MGRGTGGIMRSSALVALVVPLLLAGSLVTAASADTPTTLYVSNVPSECVGPQLGTFAQPFCSIQQAADVVVPGQTVVVLSTYTAMWTLHAELLEMGQAVSSLDAEMKATRS